MRRYAMNFVGKVMTKEDVEYLNNLLSARDEHEETIKRLGERYKEQEQTIQLLEARLKEANKTRFYAEKDDEGRTKTIYVYSPAEKQITVVSALSSQRVYVKKVNGILP